MSMGNLEEMSATQRLTQVFCLFFTAHTPAKKKRVKKELFEFYSRGLTASQITACKAMALEISEREMR